MNTSHAKLILTLLATVLITADLASAQDRGRRGPRGRFGDGPPPGGFMGGPDREWTEEDRERFYDRMLDHQHEDLVRDFALNETQSAELRAHLQQLAEKQRAYFQEHREELESMRTTMREVMTNRNENPEQNRERMRELFEKGRAIRENAPLMNPDNVIESIKPLLPEEQYEKGLERRRERREEFMRRMEERMQSWREGRTEGVEERARPRGDRWDRYVAFFKETYQLDESQQATADSILRTLKEERQRYLDSHQEKYDALNAIEDRRERREKRDELDQPIDGLYEQLQTRLRKIPTSAQVAAAEAARPTTRPGLRRMGPDGELIERGGRQFTVTATRPAEPDTRPAE